jgi:hypothetical protein
MADDRTATTGTDEYARMMARLLRSYPKLAKAGELDTTSLEHLAAIRSLVDDTIGEVVHALRSEAGGSYSWSAVGDALGITRAAAFKKYGAADSDARRPGGQPAELR